MIHTQYSPPSEARLDVAEGVGIVACCPTCGGALAEWDADGCSWRGEFGPLPWSDGPLDCPYCDLSTVSLPSATAAEMFSAELDDRITTLGYIRGHWAASATEDRGQP